MPVRRLSLLRGLSIVAASLVLIAPIGAQTEAGGAAKALRFEDIELAPTPWEVGEFLDYSVIDPRGNVLGVFYLWSEPVEGEDGAVRFWTRRYQGVGNQVVGTVRVDPSSLKPLDSQVHPAPGQLLFSTYTDAGVIVDAAGMSREIPMDRETFDSQTMVHLMRRLPLDPGLRVRIPVFDAIAGLHNVRFDVEEDWIKFKSDRVECFKVTSSTGLTCWFSKDEHRLPLWIQQGEEFRCVLAAQRRLDEALDTFDSRSLRCTLEAPADWILGQPTKATKEGTTAIAVCLREPSSVFIEIFALDEDEPREVEQFANRARNRAGKRYRGYRVRPDSWAMGIVDGHPMTTFTADYREEGEPGWVQARSFIRADRHLAEFVYRAPDAEFRSAEEQSPYFPLPASADDVLAGLSKNFRRQVRNARNRLEREGTVELAFAGKDVPVDEAMDCLIRLHRKRWGPEDGSFDTDAYVRFHRALSRAFHADGRLLLVLLRLDGVAIAARYDFVYAGRIWCFQGGWDPDFERMRVGTLLTAEVLRFGAEQGLVEYAFLSGDDAYKLRWTQASRPLFDVLIWGRGPRPLLARAKRRVKGLLRKLLRRA